MLRQGCDRIVSLLAAGTEILYGLGIGDRLVAISHECDFPAEALSKPRITQALVDSSQSSAAIDQQVKQLSASGAALYQVDRAKLVQLRPDLVITQAQCDVCAVSLDDVLRVVREEPALQNTRVVALNPSSIGDLLNDILRVAESAGVLAAGESYVATLRGRIDRVRQVTDTIRVTARPRVACIEWLEPLMVAANWTPELVSLAGGQYGLAEAGRHSCYTDWGSVTDYDPEVLILSPCGFDLERTLAELKGLPVRPGWSDLTAAKTGRVHALDGKAYLNRCGPRLVDSLEVLAHLIHPDQFQPPPSVLDARAVWRDVHLDDASAA